VRCTAACNPPTTVYELDLSVVGPLFAPKTGLRVTVGPPWRVRISGTLDLCISASQPGCAHIDNGSYNQIEVVTDDPDAPARNVVIERAAPPVTCP
jgi:hypothetical protein